MIILKATVEQMQQCRHNWMSGSQSKEASIQLQEAEVDVSDETKIALKYPDDFIVDRHLELP